MLAGVRGRGAAVPVRTGVAVSGWVPMPADVWPLVAERYPTPWEDEVAAFDLRWHADRGALPSRRTLATRWGWTSDEVRTLLRHPERWWDPKKGPPPASRNELTQRRQGLTQPDPALPGRGPVNATNGDAVTQPDPASPGADPPVPQRVDPPSPTPTQKTQGAPRPSRPKVNPWRAIWDEEWAKHHVEPYAWAQKAPDQIVQAAKALNRDKDRFRRAVSTYLAAVAAREAWPHGEPGQVRIFARDVDKWAHARGPPAQKPQYASEPVPDGPITPAPVPPHLTRAAK